MQTEYQNTIQFVREHFVTLEARPWLPYTLFYSTAKALYTAVTTGNSEISGTGCMILPVWLKTLDLIPLNERELLNVAVEKDSEDMKIRSSVWRTEEIRKQRADLYLALKNVWEQPVHEVFEFVKSLPLICPFCKKEWMQNVDLKTSKYGEWCIKCPCGHQMGDNTTNFTSNIILEVHPVLFRYDADSDMLDERIEFTAHELERKYGLPGNLNNHTTWCIMMAKKEMIERTKPWYRQKAYRVVVRDTQRRITATCAINLDDRREDVGNYFSY